MRRMRANPSCCGERTYHGVEHDESWDCAYGIPCVPVDSEIDALKERVEKAESRAANAVTQSNDNRNALVRLQGRMDDAENRIRSVKACVNILERRADKEDAQAQKPAEPEMMICENAGKCLKDCHRKVAHRRNPECFGRCMTYGVSGYTCISVAGYYSREDARKEAEAKAVWEKEAKEGARVKIFNRNCPKCGCISTRYENHQTLSNAAEFKGIHNFWWTKDGPAVCHRCAVVIAPPEPKMTPEVGDFVQTWCEGEQRILAIAAGRGIVGESGSVDLSKCAVLSRPAFVAGEAVMHREHKEWGAGYIVPGAIVCALIAGHIEYDLSRVYRICWDADLHKGAK